MLFSFFVALNEYNQVLSEDYRVNRLKESLELFEEVTSSQALAKVHFFCFFNKDDLFKAKLSSHPLSEYIDNFDGPDNYQNSLNFIMQLFESRFGGRNKQRPLDHYHPLVTCAMDTANLKEIMERVHGVISKIQFTFT